MDFFDCLIKKEKKLAVIGLGYVGMPLAIEFAKHLDVIGFDISENKINCYKNGVDVTKEVGDEELKSTSIFFTSNESDLENIAFYVVAVPTPVNLDRTPNLDPVIGACEVVARCIKKDSIVVFESTVYPGVTEEICIPIIEKKSGLKHGKDWWIGYSPERINPADKVHRLWNIKKIVSGTNDRICDEIAKVYSLVVKVGVHKVSTIKTAEAIKVVENSQRDVNIAFMNELAIVFDKMGIDTKEVVDGMNTKWNALGFTPGLVGGHCIGVDPYYFIYQAEKLGYHSQIILSGRKINDSIPNFIASSIIKHLVINKTDFSKCNVLVLGGTFKENCPDIRNSKVFDIIYELLNFGLKVDLFENNADKYDIFKEYSINTIEDLKENMYDCVVLAVAHENFKQINIKKLFKKDISKKIIFDIKSVLNKAEYPDDEYLLWRL